MVRFNNGRRIVRDGRAFYPHLPTLVASHWNAQGNVDGYASRGGEVFAVPIIFLIVALLLYAVPRIDPHRKNIEKFRKYYDYFLIAFAIFFYYLYLVMLLWNVGYQFNTVLALLPALAALFYLLGLILPHTEQNWTMGIRTPWTLSSETVWKKTHIVGGWAFKAYALIILCGILLPLSATIWLIVLPIIIIALGLVVYSYVLYEKEKKHHGRHGAAH